MLMIGRRTARQAAALVAPVSSSSSLDPHNSLGAARELLGSEQCHKATDWPHTKPPPAPPPPLHMFFCELTHKCATSSRLGGAALTF